MSEQLFSTVAGVLTAMVGLGVIAVIVSKNADTANILSAGSSGFARGLLAAEAPVLGSSLNVAGTYSSAGYQM